MILKACQKKKIFKKYTKNISWCDDAYKAMTKSNALIILTEWNEFRALDISKVKNSSTDQSLLISGIFTILMNY